MPLVIHFVLFVLNCFTLFMFQNSDVSFFFFVFLFFYFLRYGISLDSTVSHTLQLKETDLGSFLEIGDDEINAIELDMRIRLAELQRLYKEKQKLYAKLQPKKSDKEKDRIEYVTDSC